MVKTLWYTSFNHWIPNRPVMLLNLFLIYISNLTSLLLFNRSVVSDSLWPHGWQHTRLPCPSPSPRACSNSHPLSWWCHPTISSSVVPFSSRLQSFPASESFPVKSFSFMMPVQWIFRVDFSLGLTHLLAFQGTLKRLLQHQSSKVSLLQYSPSYGPALTSIHDYWQNHSFDYLNFIVKVMSLFFNMLSRFVTAFVPRSMCLILSWPQSPSAVILEPKKIKFVTVSIVSTSICPEVM